MKPLGIVGVVLIIVGVLILIFGGFSFSHNERVAKVGPVEINAQKQESVPISPIAGYGCLIGGVALLVVGGRKV